MRLSIRARLFIAHASVLALALVGVTLLAGREQRGWLVQQNVATLERAARLVAREVEAVAPARGAWPGAAAALGGAAGARVTLIDAAGRVLGDSELAAERLDALENHAGRPEVREALAGRAGHAIRRSRTLGEDLLYVAVPARGPGVAVVRLAQPLTVIASLDASLRRLSLAAAGLTLPVLLLLVHWLVGRFTARVRRLEAVTDALGAGREARARERPDDELGRLGRAINRMAAEARARLESLRAERDERETILAHLRDGVALIDASGRVVRMNRSLAAMLGAALPAEPGTAFGEFVRAPEVDEIVRRARAEDRTLETGLRAWTPEPRHLHATATPLGAPGRGGVILVLHDRSESERLDRVRQDFVANVSHELRTPLTSLRGYAETLLDGGLEDAARREEFVRVIRDQAVRLEALANDLLSLAELERPGARPRLERCDLRELVERQAAAFRPRADRSGHRLEMAPGPAAPIEADRGLIDQAVANLLDNALRHADPGPVRIAVGTDGGDAWCEVEDAGPGIPEEDQPRIFERFYRVDRTRSRERGGTGLGLAIVKHAAVLHGGDVTVRSRPGAGSAFRLTVPGVPRPAPSGAS